MKFELRHNKNFWAGIVLIVIGGGAMCVASDYRFGSAMKMGPGFLPTILGVVLMLFGVAITVRGVVHGEKISERLSIRALILLPLALLLFGFLINVAGFIPAITALVLCATYAGKEFNLLEVCLLIIGLIALSVGVFIWGLDLPYPLIKGC